MNFDKKYYLSTIFWSITQKVIGAIYAFISVPLLLDFYGKSSYGLLAVATSFNAYMHLLDLGMNHGATRFFSRWRTEGRLDKINNAARSNITFYGIIALINIVLLLFLAFFGEGIFSVTHVEFLQLRECLVILALFSFLSWGATTFNQLLTADGQLAYAMKLQCIIAILKCMLVGSVFLFQLSLTTYFFILTAIVSSLYFPYMFKCKKDKLIDSIKPAWVWSDFKVVMKFSLSLFVLALFQVTAKDTRSIILSIMATDGAGSVAEYAIISAIPQMIIMLGGTLSGIFLPKTSSIVVKNSHTDIGNFAYNWTLRTTIFMCMISFPFMLCSKELLSAYVGSKYVYLSPWLSLWCTTVFIQNHTAPLSSLIYGYGRTKELVCVTIVACIISMIINASLCKFLGVGSAVVGYFVYVALIIGSYYLYFNKKILSLNRLKVLKCFLKPTIIAIFYLFLINFAQIDFDFLQIENDRVFYLVICALKSIIWLVLFVSTIHLLKIFDFRLIINNK